PTRSAGQHPASSASVRMCSSRRPPWRTAGAACSAETWTTRRRRPGAAKAASTTVPALVSTADPRPPHPRRNYSSYAWLGRAAVGSPRTHATGAVVHDEPGGRRLHRGAVRALARSAQRDRRGAAGGDGAVALHALDVEDQPFETVLAPLATHHPEHHVDRLV